jgi:hypothetical protein
VSPVTFPIKGGARLLTVSGADMKDRGSVVLSSEVLNATLGCRVPPSGDAVGPGGVEWAKDGTRIVCEVPDAVGSDWVVTVHGRQTVGRYMDAALSFVGTAPVVTRVVPSTLATGGGVVEIEGDHFVSGVPMFPMNPPTVLLQVRGKRGKAVPGIRCVLLCVVLRASHELNALDLFVFGM